MAIPKDGLIIIALLLTAIVLETGRFSGHVSPVLDEEEHVASREKRDAPSAPIEYDVDVELNITGIESVDYLKRLLDGGNFTVALGPTVNVTHINITTVCTSNSSSTQCRCEEQYGWSYSNCIRHGACDGILGGTCRCINSFPTSGEYCRPQTELPILYEYQVVVEVRIADAEALRIALDKTPFPIEISSQFNVSEANLTTVCSNDGNGTQCQCEDDYLWPCEECATYGKCGDNTTSTCGCIKAFPKDGQYCQSVHHQKFLPCNVSSTSPPPTTPPVVYEYVVSVELIATDAAVIKALRSLLYPIVITGDIQVSTLNISTVCSASSGGYQCRCEDQYRWPCDHCVRYGSCDNITEDTCGCINSVPPDGRYCQPADPLNLTVCSVITTTPPTTTPIVNTTTPTAPTNSTPTVTPTPTANVTTPAIVNTTTPTAPTTPPVVYEYVIFIELNTTDDSATTRLREISYPIEIPPTVEVSDLNITTVCSASSGGYQCRCEDQYRWPCDHCVRYGSCDNITEDTCGCINSVPPDGRYCQPADPLNLTVCSVTTTTPPTTTPFVNTTTPTAPTNSTPTVTPTPTANVTNSTTTSTTTAITPAIVNTTTPTTPTNSTPTVTPTPTANVTAPAIVNTTTPTTPTNSTPTVTPTPTANVTDSTTTGTTTSKTTATTTPIVSTAKPTSFNVIMSIELNKTYTEDLADESSPAYRELEREINDVLVLQYASITGLVSVSVVRFRNGSVIADFIVETTVIIPDEVASANTNLSSAIDTVAPVIGPVTALYNSPNEISLPDLTYTGQSMTLKCNPDNLDVGNISGSEWKFNKMKINPTTNKRFSISRDQLSYELRIDNVILLDTGLYECYLTGGIISFSQNTTVKTGAIIQAPIIQLKSQIHVQCEEGKKIPLLCCVQDRYSITWFSSEELPLDDTYRGEENCIEHVHTIENCGEPQTNIFSCRVVDLPYTKQTTVNIFTGAVNCRDNEYGDGQEGNFSTIRCDEGQEGFQGAKCVSGTWTLVEDTCILTEISELLINSEGLDSNNVNNFTSTLNMTVSNARSEIVNSSQTISAIVDIIGNIANVDGQVSRDVMADILGTVDVIIGDNAIESWAFLNANASRNVSSSLLGSLEDIANRLDGVFDIETGEILLRRTKFNDSLSVNLSNSIIIYLPSPILTNVFITTIAFRTLDNVMPVRDFNATRNETVINGAVVIAQTNDTVRNVSLSYEKLNNSLSEVPQCVFWNFTLFDNLGAWDENGCTFVSDINNRVTCNCNHLTSFSILMSTNLPPKELREALDIITYIGVAISLASLVICLIIEGYVWKAITRNSTAFMRHVCIINTALSLLVADICFIIGAFLAKEPLENPGQGFEIPLGPCSTATFFMHLFYLALFFWMLVSGLLLFYRTVMVFSHMSRSIMLGIGFLLGYGCPLIIAVITVAVTAPGEGYIRKDNACWLNWFETHALLALVIPALAIVAINIAIIIVVLVKMLRRGVGDAAQTDERHTLVVILRCVIILTPLFGLTWALGIGTLISTDSGIHIAFAFFNSLQGFFILVFGTLFDSKVRSILSRRSPTSSTGSNNTTRSTSGGISSRSGLNWLYRLRGRRYIYHVSETANSNSNTGASESFTNI